MSIRQGLVGPLCITGLAVSWVGCVASIYIRIKTGAIFTGWMEKYRKLVNEGGYSPWPIHMVYICLPLGVLIVSGAILLLLAK